MAPRKDNRLTARMVEQAKLPGYYGRPWDYDYQGSYYGGKQVDYFWRLPYACGVYGYC